MMGKTRTHMLMALSLAVVGMMLIGGFSVAAFTDQAALENQRFSSARLNLSLDKPNGAHYFDLTQIAPGDWDTETVVVRNHGTVDIHYTLTLMLSGPLSEGEAPLKVVILDEAGSEIDPQASRLLSRDNEDILTVLWAMPEEAGNAYQAATASLALVAHAKQVID